MAIFSPCICTTISWPACSSSSWEHNGCNKKYTCALSTWMVHTINLNRKASFCCAPSIPRGFKKQSLRHFQGVKQGPRRWVSNIYRNHSKIFFNVFILVFYVHECFAYQIRLCIMYGPSAWWRHQNHWDWRFRWLWAAVWVLELGSSGRVTVLKTTAPTLKSPETILNGIWSVVIRLNLFIVRIYFSVRNLSASIIYNLHGKCTSRMSHLEVPAVNAFAASELPGFKQPTKEPQAFFIPTFRRSEERRTLMAADRLASVSPSLTTAWFFT